MIREALYILFLIAAYGLAEVRHDEAVSRDSCGGFWNRRWHRWDAWFHTLIALAVWAATDIWHGLLVLSTRAVFFDTLFSQRWKNDWLYVGEHEPEWKRRYILLYRIVSIIIYFLIVYKILFG